MKTKLLLVVVAVCLFSCNTKKKGAGNVNRNTDATKTNQQKPNIVFLFADDQRANSIHALGNKEVITPNLDKLVNDGLSFTEVSFMGAMNAAVCSPSRAMLISGRTLFHVDPNGSTIDSSDVTLPKALENGGYHTFHTGKWHNGTKAFQNSFEDGSKIFFGGMHGQYTVPTHEYNPKGIYTEKNLNKISPLHSSVLYANAAIKFIDGYNGDKPFFLNVAFQAPHDPREMPEKYIKMYNADTIALPKNFMPIHPFDNGEIDVRDEWLAGLPRTSPEIKANIISYYAMITHLDEQIGRIMDALKEKGLMDNTIIVFSADNGLAVGQHGLMGKQNLYEQSIRVPLIFKGPNIPKGKRVNNSTYLFDIYPTLCDLAGVKIPATAEGKSLSPIIKGENKELYKAQLYAYKNFQRAVKKNDWKLIKYNVKGVITTQLFDLKKDPYEMNNLAQNSQYANKLREMTTTMQELMTKYNDPVDLSKPDWGVLEIPAWKDRIPKEELENFRKMAEEERRMRGF